MAAIKKIKTLIVVKNVLATWRLRSVNSMHILIQNMRIAVGVRTILDSGVVNVSIRCLAARKFINRVDTAASFAALSVHSLNIS